MIATEDTVEILAQEGESGSETVGFSGATTLDIQKRRGRPTNTGMLYNLTNTIALVGVYPVPIAYWGNFATLFDETIVAGTRLDGQGIGFSGVFGSNWDCYANGLGGSVNTPPRPNYLPPTYTFNTIGNKGTTAGLDIFFQTSMSNVNVSINYIATGGGLSLSVPIIVNKVPQIGVLAAGVVVTKERPQGYNPGENGVQVFFNTIVASTLIPPGFVNPGAVGVPNNVLANNGGNNLQFTLVP